MSGLLRRIKRSRTADAGTPVEGQAAAPEGAAPATEASAGDPSATGETVRLPAVDATGASASGEPATSDPSAGGDATPQGDAAPAAGAAGGGEAAAAAEPAAKAKAEPRPVLLADPNVPAGVDPAEAPLRPPAGRRGRLRRRLRYLRRARELMLRDLGGLLYEVHRSGGGDVLAHAPVMDAKVQRIAGLDAEAHALEAALTAPRTETVIFQPGIGGSCPTCGDLYGSAARFCSNCGTAFGHVPTQPAAESTSSGATMESIFGRPGSASPALSSGDPLRVPGAATPEGEAKGDDPQAEPAASRWKRPGLFGPRAPGEAPPAAEPEPDAPTEAVAPAAPVDGEAAAPADAPEPTAADAPEPSGAGDDAPEASPDATPAADAADAPAAATEDATDADAAAPHPEPHEAAEPPTEVHEPGPDAPTEVREPAAGTPAPEPAADEPAEQRPDEPRDERTGGGGSTPFGNPGNGRSADRTPSDDASRDPLVSREWRQ